MDEIFCWHAFLAFGLEFKQFERSARSAAHDQLVSAYAQFRPHKFVLNRPRRPHREIPVAEGGIRPRPGLKAAKPIVEL